MTIDPIEILRKEPFRRILPDPFPRYITAFDKDAPYQEDNVQYQLVSQADFMREYEVGGHKILSRGYYPDKTKYDDEKKQFVTEILSRVAFPFQYVITVKQLCHLCGNNIDFKLSDARPSQQDHELLHDFVQGWLDKNMETAWYYAARAEKITGDAAFCGYMANGIFRWRVFSYLEGDVLFPHYDPITGDLDAFGRKYKLYDEKGRTVDYLDVWDNRYIYHFRRSNTLTDRIRNTIKRFAGLSGWAEVEPPTLHGFDFIPIAYKRSPIGPCWSPSQDNIENYELAVSQLAENNKAFAFPILFIKSTNDLDVEGTSDGRPTMIVASDESADAKTLNRADASSSFELQLRILLENIFRGSFAVNPPEIKGGDLPGVTVKLIYSPAIEKAMADSQEWNSFMDEMVNIFKQGYGIETGRVSRMNALRVRGDIIPYVHQNVAETISNLVQSKVAGILSTRTATELNPYASNAEYEQRLEEERRAIQSPVQQSVTTQVTETAQGDNVVNRTRETIAKAQNNS